MSHTHLPKQVLLPDWARWDIQGRGQLKCDDTCIETGFRLSAKPTSPFKSAGGHQFSRLLAAEVCASAVVMLDTPCSEVVWRVLATHSIQQFLLHFSSRGHHVSSHFNCSLQRVTMLKLDGPPTKSGHDDSKCQSNQQSHRLNVLQ
jgi:hypothetical protein